MLVLRDSSGGFVASGFETNGIDNTLTFTANETGTFFVDVTVDELFGATGDYELTANTFEDDFSADVNTIGVLTSDGTAATGAIDFAGDDDWFAIDLIAGETYSIVLTSDTIFAFDLFLNLLDSSGGFVTSGNSFNGLNNTLTFTASETGTFFVDVAGNEFFGATGDYELTANSIEDDFTADVNTTGVLTSDGTVTTGSIDVAGDSDWFAIDLVAGEFYSIDLTGISISDFDVSLGLFDDAGNFVTSAFSGCLLYTSPSPRDRG